MESQSTDVWEKTQLTERPHEFIESRDPFTPSSDGQCKNSTRKYTSCGSHRKAQSAYRLAAFTVVGTCVISIVFCLQETYRSSQIAALRQEIHNLRNAYGGGRVQLARDTLEPRDIFRGPEEAKALSRLARSPRDRATKRPKRTRRRKAKEHITAAHFRGSVEGITNHKDAIIDGWKPAAWVDRMSKEYRLDRAKQQVTVLKSGLYYIYAQITYHNPDYANGHDIMSNNTVLFQCTVKAYTEQRIDVTHSCYAGGVAALDKNDHVFVRHRYRERMVHMRPGLSYFGLFRLANIPTKK